MRPLSEMQSETAALAMDAAIQHSMVRIGAEDRAQETLCWNLNEASRLVIGGEHLRLQFKKLGGGGP